MTTETKYDILSLFDLYNNVEMHNLTTFTMLADYLSNPSHKQYLPTNTNN